ncbi:hypothetical protein MNL07_06545 [Bartonella krasnovii]|uniref:hypothetical protein n=1 Tax=Bartonella krasnovii TaxID=2267275 RepID=UPI001F4CAC0B|nr:hypothetical protein [Bartonella krasnovii]UNF43545.1 hypothetical protein MNL07_06545 [Bartonella krasnovii]UNF46736.1 hypothetical protein MNL05_06645 [Bartonella krasnovii]
MEGISSNKLKNENKEASLNEAQSASPKKPRGGPFRHMLFLFLLTFRKPIVLVTKVMAVFFLLGAGLLSMMCFIGEKGGMPLSIGIPMIIVSALFGIGNMYLNWYYDILLLRLSPENVNLSLFQ